MVPIIDVKLCFVWIPFSQCSPSPSLLVIDYKCSSNKLIYDGPLRGTHWEPKPHSKSRISNPAPGELPSWRFQLQPQSNTPEPANQGVQGWNWSLQDGSSPGAGLEIPALNQTRNIWFTGVSVHHHSNTFIYWPYLTTRRSSPLSSSSKSNDKNNRWATIIRNYFCNNFRKAQIWVFPFFLSNDTSCYNVFNVKIHVFFREGSTY